MSGEVRWDKEADVVVVGFGGAGAVAAIVAHDAGASVMMLEKQPADTPTVTRHTPSTRMCGGGWFGTTDAEKAALYMEGMVRIANETLDTERRQMLAVFAQYLVTNNEWMQSVGVEIGAPDYDNDGQGHADYTSLPGAEAVIMYRPQAAGTFRHGAALFRSLSRAVQSRGINVMWEAPAVRLVNRNGEVIGVEARVNGRMIRVKANRAVVLACGGFEFSDFMKENYLRVNPTHFYGNPANTGDGINLAIDVGAALWHMNDVSWRVTMRFPDFPQAFGTQYHETASLFVDRSGRRFTSERFNMHAFGYELTPYDARSMCYPRVPSFWIFGEKRRTLCALASQHGACNPPGGVSGDIHYVWSTDNSKEIERGWIIKAKDADELASKLAADPDNGGLLKPDILRATIKQYDDYCRKGEDLDFHKPKQFLQPLESPPYYAVKLWPGGPNTHGGPKRNVKAQVVRTDNAPVPRLYSAGELGSVWGMLYQGGGDIAECVAFGRIAGANAAREKAWK